MNLLFLSTVYPDASQPARGTYNAALCRALAESHGVRVVSPRAWPEYWRTRMQGRTWSSADADTSTGIKVAIPCLYYIPGCRTHRLGDAMERSTRLAIDHMQRERPIDAILSYWIHPDGDAALRAAQRLGVPSAVIVGGSDVLLLPKDLKRGREILRVLRETDFVLTVSEGLRQAVIELDIDPNKVHTVYQGIDSRVFHPGSKVAAREAVSVPEDAQMLLWAGRMVEVKRLDLLIEAFPKILATRPKALLCLVGTGPKLAECRQSAADAGISNQVRFVGAVAPDALGNWYRAADLTVLSSDSEGLPNVLRESLACGTPYVTTDVGDIREIDGGRSGRFVPRGDVGQLSQTIVQAIDDVGRSLRVEEVPPRTWKDMSDEIVSLFDASHSSLAPAIASSSQTLAISAGEGAFSTLANVG